MRSHIKFVTNGGNGGGKKEREREGERGRERRRWGTWRGRARAGAGAGEPEGEAWGGEVKGIEFRYLMLWISRPAPLVHTSKHTYFRANKFTFVLSKGK